MSLKQLSEIKTSELQKEIYLANTQFMSELKEIANHLNIDLSSIQKIEEQCDRFCQNMKDILTDYSADYTQAMQESLRDQQNLIESLKELIFPDSDDFILTNVNTSDPDNPVVELESVKEEDTCPNCHQKSHASDGRYQRKAWTTVNNRGVLVILTTKRFKCQNPDCKSATFTQNIPFLEKYQRRFLEVNEQMISLSTSMSFSETSRTMKACGVGASSNSSMMRLFSRVVLPEPGKIRIAGIDDAAKRKGMDYMSVVVNQQTHEPVKIIDGRKLEDIEPFLCEHEEIEILSRDRSRTYKAGGEQFLNCSHIVDRFHLMDNMIETLKKAAKKVLPGKIVIKDGKMINSDVFYLGDKKRERQKNSVDDSLTKNLPEKNIPDTVVDYTTQVPEFLSGKTIERTKNSIISSLFVVNKELSSETRQVLEIVERTYPEIAEIHQAYCDFYYALMLSENPEEIDTFIEKYKNTAELKRFCNGLKKDLDGIKNSIIYNYNNGVLEGTNSRLKLVKRRYYGRLSLEKLEKIFRLSYQANRGKLNYCLAPVSERI